MANLPSGSQHAAEAGFAGNIGSLIGQHRHDTRRRQLGKPRFVGDLHDLLALCLAERMRAHGPYGLRAAIADLQTLAVPPSLQGARIDSGDLAGSP
jgi:hypothetical protein